MLADFFKIVETAVELLDNCADSNKIIVIINMVTYRE